MPSEQDEGLRAACFLGQLRRNGPSLDYFVLAFASGSRRRLIVGAASDLTFERGPWPRLAAAWAAWALGRLFGRSGLCSFPRWPFTGAPSAPPRPLVPSSPFPPGLLLSFWLRRPHRPPRLRWAALALGLASAFVEPRHSSSGAGRFARRLRLFLLPRTGAVSAGSCRVPSSVSWPARPMSKTGRARRDRTTGVRRHVASALGSCCRYLLPAGARRRCRHGGWFRGRCPSRLERGSAMASCRVEMIGLSVGPRGPRRPGGTAGGKLADVDQPRPSARHEHRS